MAAINGLSSAAYALGAIGAAFAAYSDWTQLTDGLAISTAGQASQTWLGQMIAATSVYAIIVLLVLKVRVRTHIIVRCVDRAANGCLSQGSV